MPELVRFHLAFPVHDLEAARRFYVELMGARVGRESARWIDFDFFGHQITAHLAPPGARAETNPVDGDDVPVRHFGAVLDWAEWERAAERLRAAGVKFLIEPHVRFAGEVGEQATLFLLDPSDNAIELKAFRRPEDVFAR
jgi:extradiol dioxygenase family protein